MEAQLITALFSHGQALPLLLFASGPIFMLFLIYLGYKLAKNTLSALLKSVQDLAGVIQESTAVLHGLVLRVEKLEDTLERIEARKEYR